MAKHNKSKDKAAEDKMQVGGTVENTENVSHENMEQQEACKNELETAAQKYNELNDKYLRLYSDFDNYRKRAIKERIDLSKTASEEIISSLLPIIDDFERALGVMTREDEDPIKQGTLLIYNKMKNILTQKGLAETEAMGLEFNTDFHEAIANIPAPAEEMKNKIIDVTQKGYTLNGKVIRFAKVVVGI